MEKVSVIIPTYNRADVLKTSIQSVLQQTYSDFELLIVDDGSTDNTNMMVESLNDARIRYLRMPQNRGVAAARNEGIRQAEYSYIAFQDSDDYWKPEKLEKQMAFLAQRPEAGLLYCPYECKKADGSALLVPGGNIPPEEKQGNIYPYMLCRNTIGAPTVLLRRQCLERSGLFCESLTCLEDWELFLRISRNSEIAFQEEPMVSVSLSRDGVSHNISGYYEARCYMLARHKDALLRYGIFQDVTRDILESAEKTGVLSQISKMMQYYLRQA
ncbi:MAG: glycosyltransferase family 2 protein [Blautia sp.]|nr:glycosyltransferase family 2 protein [Blautia sp.]MCM1200179.1 glycosyltransferase family 2 protein [Bacteroides fragilis]